MRHLFPPLRGGSLRLVLSLIALVSLSAPGALAQSPPTSQPLAFAYHDSQGSGRFTMLDVGPDAGSGGRQIKVTLTQNGLSYRGSGITYPLETTSPYTTLVSFTLVSVRTGISYHFSGKTISGITLSGSGIYTRSGVPEQKANWSIVLGGGGGGTTGPSALRGVAEAGPIFPHERPGIPNTRPLPGAIITVQPAGGGPEIARSTADQNGRFQIPLAPGTYLIVPLPPQPGAVLPRGIPQTVTVRAGGFTEVVVEYDTGIR
jgi:hypothetical protein